jgi:hypothetical protein
MYCTTVQVNPFERRTCTELETVKFIVPNVEYQYSTPLQAARGIQQLFISTEG